MARMNTKRARRFALASGLLASAHIGSASAQTADRLARADSNGDGAIEWQEVLDMRASGFERMDRNDDGFVDLDDRPRFGPGRSRFETAFNQLKANSDADGDGRITQTEMIEAPAPVFTAGDTDEDGTLSADEIAALPQDGGN